ncbi:MAG: response regulator [Planctomycetales bacterium]|nr:response regulator [Planctomycetales bacterium]
MSLASSLPNLNSELPMQLPPMMQNAPVSGKADGTLTTVTSNSKILVVDDEPVNIKVVRKYLQQWGYQRFVTTSDATQAFELIMHEQPDLILLDVVMPGINGLDILAKMRSHPLTKYLPVLILTAATDPETKFRALELGATDFLSKPVDPGDLAPRVRNALMVKSHQDHLKHYADELARQVRMRTAELAASRQDVILCLARAGEYRDHETGNHVLRVGLFVGEIARELGMDEDTVENMEQAALLHDVGKIGVSDLILLKPGKLTEDEFNQMKRHCEFGRNIIQPNPDLRWRALGTYSKLSGQDIPIGSSPIMAMAARIAFTHHERWDGTGYPRGLQGEEIPIEGRITAVADVYDALSSVRPYKRAFPPDECFRIMQEASGKHFDPQIFDAFSACLDRIRIIQRDFADTPTTSTPAPAGSPH